MNHKGITKAVLTLMMASLLHITSSAVYYITPDNPSQFTNDNSTLQHYLVNAHKYFNSHTQLYFLPGQYYLQHSFILQNIFNFTIHGDRSVLICNSSSVGMIISNVESLTINNIELKLCSKAYDVKIDSRKHEIDNLPFHWRAAMYFHDSTAVVICNVSIIISDGVSGMIVVNSKTNFTIVNVSVLGICEQLNSITSGMLFYNDDDGNNLVRVNYIATYISYKTNGLCHNSFAIVLLMTQDKYSIIFNVYNTSFIHLNGSSIMYYHSTSCGMDNTNVVTFQKCKMKYNHGTPYLNMFYISIHSEDYIFLHVVEEDKKTCNRQNIINFRECSFTNNSNMNSLIYVNLKNCLALNTIINIRDSHILNNNNVKFIMSNSQLKTFWQMSLFITLMSTNISFNMHDGLAGLISLTNAVMKFMKNVIIKENQYKLAIIQLHFATLKFTNCTEFSDNHARYILHGKEASFYLLEEGTTLNITNNIVYTAIHNTLSFDDDLKEICWFQFVSKRGNLDKDVTKDEHLNFKILLINNRYIAPIHQLQFLKERNCSWLIDTAFQTAPSGTVYGKIIKSSGKLANKSEMKTIPSRLCHCSHTNSYNCTERELGQIFPGQTLQVQMMMDTSIPSKNAYMKINVETDKLPKRGCIMTDVREIIQIGPKHSCSKYNYTIGYSGKYTKCELYLSIENVSEIFYVTIKACPVGFSLDSSRKTCDCDVILSTHTLMITSCNLNEGTILHPANSWLSASTVNGFHTYHVALPCPFDYCLPYSSHLHLSNPDTQCQFDRSGALCGQCK